MGGKDASLFLNLTDEFFGDFFMRFLALSVIGVSVFFTFQAQGESVTSLVKTGVGLYNDYKKSTAEPEETDLQRAGRLATPVMPTMEQAQINHDKREKLDACHKENDFVIMGKTFVSTKCNNLQE